MSRSPFLLATRSAGKLRELRPMFDEAGIAVVDLVSAGIAYDPVEDTLEVHDSFEENAVAKARYFHRISGMPTLADDSGLEVTALGGAPGVRSKRWSARADLEGGELDEANNRVLRERLVGEADRRARYVCAAALVEGDEVLVERGEVSGVISAAALGDAGFGYDPYFIPVEGDGRSFGEMSRAEKERISHRGRAFRALLGRLGERGRD